MLEVVCVEAARMPHYCHWLVDTSLDSDQWSQCGQNTKHNNSQGLLGPAGTCCLLSSHHLPALPGRGGGEGRCPLKILSGGGGERGMWPLNLPSTIWTLAGHDGLLHCHTGAL